MIFTNEKKIENKIKSFSSNKVKEIFKIIINILQSQKYVSINRNKKI